METLAMCNVAPSPIVKTQTGVRPQPFTTSQQQQAALRQQQLHATATFQQFQQPSNHFQPTYPNTNNNNNNQFASTPTTSPMTRKRNSIGSGGKSPARKRANNGRK